MRRFDFVFRDGGKPEEVRLEGSGDSWRLTRDGQATDLTFERLPDGRFSILFADGRQVCGRALPGEAGEVEVVTSAGPRQVRLADPLLDLISHPAGSGSDSGDEEVRALMPGRVLEVRAREGDRVEAGQVLVVLEAMKMQNEIRASSGGVLTRCAVSSGDAVEGRALLLTIRRGPAS